MTCLECNRQLNYLEHRNSMDSFGVELCEQHLKRVLRVIRKNRTPTQAIRLYYGLKEAGESPMLEWWDGQRSIDIALSRVRLNIEIDNSPGETTLDQALVELQQAADSLQQGFTTFYIPEQLVREDLDKAVSQVLKFKNSLQVKTSHSL